jgi:hypothetical protein
MFDSSASPVGVRTGYVYALHHKSQDAEDPYGCHSSFTHGWSTREVSRHLGFKQSRSFGSTRGRFKEHSQMQQ